MRKLPSNIVRCPDCGARRKLDNFASHRSGAVCAVTVIKAQLEAAGLVRLRHSAPWHLWERAQMLPVRPLCYAAGEHGYVHTSLYVRPWVNDYLTITHGLASPIRAAGLRACHRRARVYDRLVGAYALGGWALVRDKLKAILEGMPYWERELIEWRPLTKGWNWNKLNRAYEKAAVRGFAERNAAAREQVGAGQLSPSADPTGLLPFPPAASQRPG